MFSQLKKAIPLFFAILTLSCIEVHISLYLKPDGSGKGKIVYNVVRGIYGAPDEEKIAINEDKLADQLSRREGIKVIRTGSSYENENMIRVWAEFEFKDVEKLSDGYIRYKLTKLGNNKMEFRVHYRLTGELHKREMLKSMFKGLTSSLEVEVDGKVISTNGEKISSRKVRWEIPAEEVVGQNIVEDLVLIFEPRKESFWNKLKRKLGF